jgi:hypothetical protein
MNIDYSTLEQDVYSGTFRLKLQDELIEGFRQIHASGERLPTASHYASQIAEIVNRNAPGLSDGVKYELYQETLDAVEHARKTVLEE